MNDPYNGWTLSTATVTFELTAADLTFVNADSQRVTELGNFEVMVVDLKAPFRFEK
ncbi:MAG: fibronectin type III-like domain-contianing protein [Verrucomicrobiota bacterium]